jgi:hypothetical protein
VDQELLIHHLLLLTAEAFFIQLVKFSVVVPDVVEAVVAEALKLEQCVELHYLADVLIEDG